jgi:hypothetical protein
MLHLKLLEKKNKWNSKLAEEGNKIKAQINEIETKKSYKNKKLALW